MSISRVGIQGEIKGFQNQKIRALTADFISQDKALDKLNNRYNGYSRNMANLRERSTGLRREVSKLRNDLLLLSFSFGILKTSIIDSIAESERWKNSMLGMSSVAKNTGNSITEVKQAALSLTNDGLLNLSEASAGLKNLLATQFNLPQAIKIMKTFKDAAAFNRQGTLKFGDAIVRATEGIKNQISALVDNVGITKNLSVIMKEYGYKMEDVQDKIKGAAARQALLNGLIKEGSFFVGDATKLAETYSGANSVLSTKLFKVKAALGLLFTQGTATQGVFTKMTKSTIEWVDTMQKIINNKKIFIASKLEQTYKNLKGIFTAAVSVIKPFLLVLGKVADIFINTKIGNFVIYLALIKKSIQNISPYFLNFHNMLHKFDKFFLKDVHTQKYFSSVLKGFSIMQVHGENTMNKLYNSTTKLYSAQENGIKTTIESLNRKISVQTQANKVMRENLAQMKKGSFEYKNYSKQIRLAQTSLTNKKKVLIAHKKELRNNQTAITRLTRTIDFMNGKIQVSSKSINQFEKDLVYLNRTGKITDKEFEIFSNKIDLMRSRMARAKIVAKGLGYDYDKITRRVKISRFEFSRFGTSLKKLSQEMSTKVSNSFKRLRLNMKLTGIGVKSLTIAFKTLAATAASMGVTILIGWIIEKVIELIDTSDDLLDRINSINESISELKTKTTENIQATEVQINKFTALSKEIKKTVIEYEHTNEKIKMYNGLVEKAKSLNSEYGKSLAVLLNTYNKMPGNIKNVYEEIDKLTKKQIANQIVILQEQHLELGKKLLEALQVGGKDVQKYLALNQTLQSASKDLKALMLKKQENSAIDITKFSSKEKKTYDILQAQLEKNITKAQHEKTKLQKQLADFELKLNKNNLLDLAKNAVTLKTSLIEVTDRINELQKEFNKPIPGPDVTWIGGVTNQTKNAIKSFSGYDEVISKLKKNLKSKVEVKIFDPNSIRQLKELSDTSSISNYLDELRNIVGQKNPFIFIGKDGKKKLLDSFSEFEELIKNWDIKKLRKNIGQIIIPSNLNLKGTAEEVLNKLKTAFENANKDKKLRLFADFQIKSTGRSASAKVNPLLALYNQLEAAFTKEKLGRTDSVFLTLDKQIEGFKIKLIQLLRDNNIKADPLIDKIKDLTNQLLKLSTINISKKELIQSKDAVKAYENQRSAIVQISDGYKTLSGESFDYYTKVTDHATNFANIEKNYTNEKTQLIRKLAEVQQQNLLVQSEAGEQLEKQLEKQITGLDKYHDSLVKVYKSELKLSVEQAKRQEKLNALSGNRNLGTDLLGVNIPAALQQLDDFQNEKGKKIADFENNYKAAYKGNQKKLNDLTEESLKYRQSLEEQYSNKKIELYQQVFSSIYNKYLEFSKLMDSGVNREILMLKAKTEASQQLLKDDFNSRLISAKDYQTQNIKLQRKQELEEKATADRKLIAVKREVSARLKAMAAEWVVRAVAEAAGDNYKGAALYAAAAAMAGVAASNLSRGLDKKEAQLEKQIAISQGRIDRFRGYGSGTFTSPSTISQQAGSVGGTISAQEYKVVVSPTVSISGDTVLIGNVGVEELRQTIGDVVVNTTKSAIENGEININDLTKGNIGG